MISDLSWLNQFGNRLISQPNVVDHRHLTFMPFEDGIVLI